MATNSKTKHKFVVFDVDWTMHGSALGTNLIHELLRAGLIEADFDIEKTYDLWQNSSDPGIVFMSHYYDLFQKLIGLDEAVLRNLGQQVGETAASHLYPYIESEITRHRADGRFLLLISNSPSITLEPFAKKLNIDDYSGSDFKFDENGKLHKIHSTSSRLKSDELLRLVNFHGLTLEDSYGYGDSLDDISMLELVTHPYAVSPKAELLEKAQNDNWEIVNVK